MKFNFCFLLISISYLCSCNSPSADKTGSVTTPVSKTDSTKINAVNPQPDSTATTKTSPAITDTSITVKVFKSGPPLKGFGYDILHNGSVYVHQPHIPAIPGQRDFDTEQQALAVGNLMADKIRKNTMPPSVSVEELKKLGIQ